MPKARMRTIVWKFSDIDSKYEVPEGRGDLTHEKVYARSPEDMAKSFHWLFKDEAREIFVVFWLNSANRVTGFEKLTVGTLNTSLVHPREVFRGAIVSTAAAVLISHNHPSGNKEPSREDIEITRQVVEAGKIIGIPCHDHIIFTDSGEYTSFAERGLM